MFLISVSEVWSGNVPRVNIKCTVRGGEIVDAPLHSHTLDRSQNIILV